VPDFFDPPPDEIDVVLIAEQTLRQASRFVVGCESCSPTEAEFPFDWVLDYVTGRVPKPIKCSRLPRSVPTVAAISWKRLLLMRSGAMPRTYSNLEKTRTELAWVGEAPDPNKCGCRNVRCCQRTGHQHDACTSGNRFA
jgi:hypothetical protein